MNIKEIAVSFIGFVIRAVILVLLILTLYRGGQWAYDFGFRIFTEEPMSAEPGRDVAITIVQGDSMMDVAKMLEEKGLTRDYKLLYAQKICSVYDGDVKPGFYTLNTSMTADDMFEIIAGHKDDSEDESEDEAEENTTEAAPLTEADSLEEQPINEDVYGDGTYEGSEEEGVDVEITTE